LKEDQLEFLEERRLKDLVKKHSEFINYPISIWKENSTEKEVDDDDEPEKDDSKPEGDEAKIEEVGIESIHLNRNIYNNEKLMSSTKNLVISLTCRSCRSMTMRTRRTRRRKR